MAIIEVAGLRTRLWRVAPLLLAGLFLLPSPARAQTSSPFLELPERVGLDGAAVGDIGVRDFDGDGVPDVALLGPGRLELIRGLADGWATPQSVALPWSYARLATDEITGDRYDDVVLATDNGSVAVVRGRRDGILTAPAASDIYALEPGAVMPASNVAVTLG